MGQLHHRQECLAGWSIEFCREPYYPAFLIATSVNCVMPLISTILLSTLCSWNVQIIGWFLIARQLPFRSTGLTRPKPSQKSVAQRREFVAKI